MSDMLVPRTDIVRVLANFLVWGFKYSQSAEPNLYKTNSLLRFQEKIPIHYREVDIHIRDHN